VVATTNADRRFGVVGMDQMLMCGWRNALLVAARAHAWTETLQEEDTFTTERQMKYRRGARAKGRDGKGLDI
jgi:hypothetical protein